MSTFTMHLYDNAFGDDPPEDLANILVDYGHGVGFTREMITGPVRNRAGEIVGHVDYMNPLPLRCECGETVTVYHLDWSALGCPACGGMIAKQDWRLAS